MPKVTLGWEVASSNFIKVWSLRFAKDSMDCVPSQINNDCNEQGVFSDLFSHHFEQDNERSAILEKENTIFFFGQCRMTTIAKERVNGKHNSIDNVGVHWWRRAHLPSFLQLGFSPFFMTRSSYASAQFTFWCWLFFVVPIVVLLHFLIIICYRQCEVAIKVVYSTSHLSSFPFSL